MDPLRKLVAHRLRAQAFGQHPDAEVLSAFAENALAAAEREAVVEHLSACANCRDILFLAAPPALEQQQVFAAPKARPYFALRWGTVVACIVIGAAFFVSYRQGLRTGRSPSAKQETASTQVAEKMVAQDKLPPELNSINDKERAPRISVPATPSRGHAEAKTSIAEPNATMAFDDSGQISVSNNVPLKAPLKSRSAKDFSIDGRSAGELVKLAPGAVADSPTTGGVAGKRADSDLARQAPVAPGSENEALDEVNNRVSSKYAPLAGVPGALPSGIEKASGYGYVAGTVSDSAGAAVPNAKVTVGGPLGEKTAVSDNAGKFSFDPLAAGTYRLKVDAAGFREAQSQVAVLSGKPAMADFKLQVGAVNETVEKPASVNGMLVTEEKTSNPLQAEAQTTSEVAKKQKADLHRLNSLAKIARPLLWSLSPQGTLQRSIDGGKTWVPIAVAAGSVFRAVASIGNQVWAAGNAGLLYHSLDNGQRWTKVIPVSHGEEIQADITEIQFLDPQHVVLGTSTGQGWASADSGQTWVRR